MSVQHNMTHPNITDQSAYQEPAGDPHELLVNGMEDVEPEPEAIVGMPAADALTPADRYLELFTDVQMQHIFEDSKTFADCAPKTDPLDILMLYRKQRRVDKAFDLKQFVLQNFFLPPEDDCYHHNDAAKPLCQHIDDLWNILTRQPEKHYHNSSLLPLPRSYIVPGGRFGEMYYWDSYFTMLGLAESGRQDLIQNMAENFAWMIERYGHIPNGNRTYYLSRSQPPVFSLMVELCEQAGVSDDTRYLSYLICEYQYWMDGAVALQPDQAYRHVVRMPDGMVLNRYWDDRDTPRDESWREDMATAKASERPDNEVFRDLRAGAASGWDYSSRWLREPGRLASIRTTQFIPVDLNALLYKLEMMIVRVADQAGEIVTARAWQLKADERQQAMNRWLWDDDSELYRDYDWRLKKPAAFSAAAVVALFTRVASPAQARQLARQISKHLLAPGGLLTSTLDSGEQWDKPNAWAPIQWMAIKGLEFYGEQALATEIAVRWLKTVDSYYQQEHKMVEKYNIIQEQSIPGSGGEYPLQDGFGWTNGVTRCLMTQYGHLLPAGNPPE